MRRPCFFIIFMLSFIALAETGNPVPSKNNLIDCSRVSTHCLKQQEFLQCLEINMRNCKIMARRIPDPNFYLQTVDSKSEARLDTVYGHVIHIPSEAVLRSSEGQSNRSEQSVLLAVSILNHSYFEAPQDKRIPHEQVLGVWLGVKDVQNLSHPVTIVFSNLSQTQTGTCVFWKMSNSNHWSANGCSTIKNNTNFICSCNHLSFFAVLMSHEVPDHANVQRLEYITYIGSSFSMVFTAITIVIFLCRRKTKLEHSLYIHLQLTGSLFLLHLLFLVSSYWSRAERTVCQSLGLMLHWALLATFTWTAIEGFHLYLLLVRVFNIYIRRYLLKLCLVGWGVPTVTVIICGVAGAYGQYIPNTASNTTKLCWVTTEAARYTTVKGYLGLVLLFNAIILAQIVIKIRQLRARSVKAESRVSRLWKDWASVMGLSCVLGFTWGLAITTQSLAGIYLFTILNAFQGVLMFLWLLSLTCKSSHEEQQSTKNLSMSHINS